MYCSHQFPISVLSCVVLLDRANENCSLTWSNSLSRGAFLCVMRSSCPLGLNRAHASLDHHYHLIAPSNQHPHPSNSFIFSLYQTKKTTNKQTSKMQFSTLIFTTSLLVTSVLAGWNCKCQDSNGQYNWATESCCALDLSSDHAYHDNQSHQCSSRSGGLDSGAFVRCCQGYGYGGAYCWK